MATATPATSFPHMTSSSAGARARPRRGGAGTDTGWRGAPRPLITLCKVHMHTQQHSSTYRPCMFYLLSPCPPTSIHPSIHPSILGESTRFGLKEEKEVCILFPEQCTHMTFHSGKVEEAKRIGVSWRLCQYTSYLIPVSEHAHELMCSKVVIAHCTPPADHTHKLVPNHTPWHPHHVTSPPTSTPTTPTRTCTLGDSP